MPLTTARTTRLATRAAAGLPGHLDGYRGGREAPPVTPLRRMSGVVEDAVEERLKGGRPGRLRAFFAAVAIAVTIAVLAYRLLRSGSDDNDGED